MHKAITFYWGCLWRAVDGSLNVANAWMGLWGPFLLWTWFWWRGETPPLPDRVDIYLLEFTLITLGATWVGAVIVRFFNQPVVTIEELKADIANLRAQIGNLTARLKPRINLYLDPRTKGVHVLDTEFEDNDGTRRIGPRQKYVQALVKPLTDAPLNNCRAQLTSVVRVECDRSGNELLMEATGCRWSQRSEEFIEIPAKVPHAVNLFSLEDGNSDLRPELFHCKVSLKNELQKPGRYRLTLRISAADAGTMSKAFLVTWGGSFDTIEIEDEGGVCP